jgi:hypothetical protein
MACWLLPSRLAWLIMLPPLVQNRWPGTNPGAIPVPVRATAPVAARFLRAAISAATPASTATAPAATTRRQALTTRLGAPDPLSCAMSPPISRSRPGTQTPPVDGAQPAPKTPQPPLRLKPVCVP